MLLKMKLTRCLNLLKRHTYLSIRINKAWHTSDKLFGDKKIAKITMDIKTSGKTPPNRQYQ